MVNGSIKTAGLTFYTRNGQNVVRSAHTRQPRRNTREQFVARQRMRHTNSLWVMLKPCDPMFYGGKSRYARFASMANRLPAVFLPGTGSLSAASVLLPGMPVSDGTLPKVNEWLGTVDGTPALMSDLKANDMQHSEKLLLYTLHQRIEHNYPIVRISCREVAVTECRTVDGCLALVGDQYGDMMSGWALVRVYDDRCSSQTVVTQCTYYEQYTTEEALLAAAEAYGGLTKKR